MSWLLDWLSFRDTRSVGAVPGWANHATVMAIIFTAQNGRVLYRGHESGAATTAFFVLKRGTLLNPPSKGAALIEIRITPEDFSPAEYR